MVGSSPITRIHSLLRARIEAREGHGAGANRAQVSMLVTDRPTHAERRHMPHELTCTVVHLGVVGQSNDSPACRAFYRRD